MSPPVSGISRDAFDQCTQVHLKPCLLVRLKLWRSIALHLAWCWLLFHTHSGI